MSAMAGRIPEADIIEVRLALSERAIELVTDVLGTSKNEARSNRREARWGRKGSFNLALTGPKRGLWFDHEAQEGGDLFELISTRVISGTFPDAYEWARRWLGWPVNGPSPSYQKNAEWRRLQAEKIAQDEAKIAAERVQKINYARSIWERSESIAGTIAEIYLTDTRCIAANHWPEALRFNPLQNALVVAGTTDTGEVVCVQLVHLTPEAEKIKEIAGKPAKKSHGPQDGAAVRLPGASDGPLLLAEGPETGLSAWVVTGYETWISLGCISEKLTPPRDRQIIVLMDDDKPRAPSKDPAQKAISKWEAAGLNVVTAWPWETRRKDGSDFNDVLKANGPDAVKRRIDLCLARSCQEPNDVYDLKPAREKLDQLMGYSFEAFLKWKLTLPPPVHALSVSLGVGKTALSH